MQLTPDPYEDIARTYIAVLKKDNPEAGMIIEGLQSTFGARAAVLATLVITLLRLEVKETYRIPDRSLYAVIIKDYPDALPLVNQAIERCCAAWGVADASAIYLWPVAPPRTDTNGSQRASGLASDLPN